MILRIFQLKLKNSNHNIPVIENHLIGTRTEPKNPKEHRFGRQKLPGLRIILTEKCAIVLFAIIGCVLLVPGIIFYLLVNNLYEDELRYDNKCDLGQDCIVIFHVSKQIKGPINFYYKLTKFYQNHRRFGYSRVNSQLAGEYADFDEMEPCKPYRSENNDKDPSKWTLPCGVYANSVFNDSFTWLNDTSLFSDKDITFSVEREHVFKNLSTKYTSGNKWLEKSSIFHGQTNEHFIVWMRTAPLQTFSKLYAKCKDCTIEPGDYLIKVNNRYPTDWFGGQKYIVIAKQGFFGTHQKFLGIVYLLFGCLSIAFSISILLIKLFFHRILFPE